ncbi:MAG: AraC family transcriptional regulator ligand-binding domain-containing protein [Pseudomonas sp.]|uniref:AraC family transcriptional regulator n=1 Tax=Pseudomonas sp. TaxID=306 RepID=UPI00299CF257|nr:AraC family transcriptional regulator ligand-binding domain-containing protein [Pseudomonas sp.]MDX1723789.1 AraC family transcriptional regulator ligand-binding domain-containing protein [Pseudomonas sp.]
MPALLAFCIQQMLRRGYDLGEVLRDSGLDSQAYSQPETLLNGKAELVVYANIQRLVGIEGMDELGLAIGGEVNVNSVAMLGGLVANAVDLNHAGYLLRRFQALSNRWFTPELIGSLAPGYAVVRYRQTVNLERHYGFLINLSMGGAQRLLGEIFGDAAEGFVTKVAFAYPQPEQPERHLTQFNCPVSFGHDFTYVTFDHEIGKALNPKRCEFTYNVFLQQCRESATRFASTSCQQRVLNSLLCMDEYPGAAAMAESLNCSGRSLRRHLNEEGVQYSELIDRIRFDRAVYLLSHSDDSVKSIGYQLSYSEPAAFIRAFARWSGTSPAEFRKTVARARL